jgi:two-component system chemotaxis response regulator CheB
MQMVLKNDPRIEVTIAADPLIALAKIEKQPPDVVITDLEMPRMDGLTLIRKIMVTQPVPIIVCSALIERGASLAMQALQEGAVDVITKPKVGVRDFLHESAVQLLDCVWSAAQAKVAKKVLTRKPTPAHAITSPVRYDGTVIAVGASTGGPDALSQFLTAMPPECPPIVVVQHMPTMFTKAFADRLNRDCAIHVKEAEHGDVLKNGCALIAPGGLHLEVVRRQGRLRTAISDGPLVSRHRPSVDVLFKSVAQAVGAQAVGVIMTGMGNDGAQGMMQLKAAGAETVAQNEASCVVFGMPKEAIALGSVDHVISLENLATTVLGLAARSV